MMIQKLQNKELMQKYIQIQTLVSNFFSTQEKMSVLSYPFVRACDFPIGNSLRFLYLFVLNFCIMILSLNPYLNYMFNLFTMVYTTKHFDLTLYHVYKDTKHFFEIEYIKYH